MPEVRLPLQRLLLSAGGLGYVVDAENLALQVATLSRADVTILQVVPPTDLDYPTTRDMREHAGDLLAEFVAAMRHGFGLSKILGTIHTYPTLAEANKYAAGVWKRARVTQGQMDFLTAFQAWRRGTAGLSAVFARLPALLTDKRRAYEGDDEPRHPS